MYGFNEAATADRFYATKSWERSLGTPDEYPFAATAQGDTGSHPNGFSIAAQRSRGSQFKSFLTTNNVKRGNWIQINPILD
ncbi:NucA/NucB deoxyribonuclease domain-containing protein [Corynebacterium macclintockiae]|uniref:NucA/NucB deoxyribonuclease domain-containing protein n=1 Tax=Corynebacterium macclintockiae TaxID=2913501 RepID=UPI003EC042AF